MIAGRTSSSVSLVAGSAGRQQEPPGQSLGAGARARHLSRHDHHRRHGGRARYKISREGQDEYSLQSQIAHRGGPSRPASFDDEIVPMETHDAGHRQATQRGVERKNDESSPRTRATGPDTKQGGPRQSFNR